MTQSVTRCATHLTARRSPRSSHGDIIHARPPELFIIGNGQAIFEAIRTKRARARAFLLPVDHTPWNPERSRRCQDELDTRVEPCARLVGSINRVVRYISHPAVRSARIPTLYLRGVAQPRLARREDTRQRTRNLAGRISTLPEAVRIPRLCRDLHALATKDTQ